MPEAIQRFETLTYDVREGAIAWISMNRPSVINALNDALKIELLAAFRASEQDPAVRVVVLTGAGRGFCSGQDLGDHSLDEIAGEIGHNLRTLYHPLVLAMRSMKKPILGVINGVAAGAGLSLALACDLRLAAENTTLVEAFVKIGLIPDAGNTWVLPRLVGMAKAFELAAFGDAIPAAEAYRLGLVNKVVPAAELEAEGMAWAQRLASAPTQALGLLKQALEQSFEKSLPGQLEVEAACQQQAGQSKDFREGVQAFLEKRPAQFIGR